MGLNYSRGNLFIDSVSSLQEILVPARHRLKLTSLFVNHRIRFASLRLWNVAIRMANNLLDIVDIVYPVLPADAHLTIGLFERYSPQGVPVRDLIHTAVMQTNAITHIISTDKHFDLIEGITREDPIELHQRFKEDH